MGLLVIYLLKRMGIYLSFEHLISSVSVIYFTLMDFECFLGLYWFFDQSLFLMCFWSFFRFIFLSIEFIISWYIFHIVSLLSNYQVPSIKFLVNGNIEYIV